MCIASSVGVSGANSHDDVLILQVLLNLNAHRLDDPKPEELKTDGRIGEKTLGALARFEVEAMGLPTSDRFVIAGDPTIRALLAGLPDGPSREKLTMVMPAALPEKIDLFFDPLVIGLRKYDITTSPRIAHFIAQIGHESGSFRYAEEIADGSAYEGRADLGNTQPGDGKRFKGRGLIQLTGRANYTAYSRDTGIDYVAKPELVARDPVVATDVACWFWGKRGLNALADQDDFRGITRRINGGFNGADDRKRYLDRAKAVLGLS